MPRSTRMTGILAALASVGPGSQPVSTRGGRMMASTPWAMNERRALIWLAWLSSAFTYFRSMLLLAASLLNESDSAVRHGWFSSIWGKPTVSFLLASTLSAAGAENAATAMAAAARNAWINFLMG